MALATSSFPVPLSPRIRIVESVPATVLILSSTPRIWLLVPRMPLKQNLLSNVSFRSWFSRRNARTRPNRSTRKRRSSIWTGFVLLSKHLEAFRGRRCSMDVVSDSLQGVDHRQPHEGLIVDQQDGHPLHDTLSTNDRSLDNGRHKVNVVPFPTSLSTRILPPCRSAMRRLTESPSPVPSPSFFVVKNGSKIRGSTVGGMPEPVSLTSTRHTPSATDVRIVSTPPPFMACTAFRIRFIKTCSIICRSTMRLSEAGPSSVSSRIRFGANKWFVSTSTRS